MGKIDSHKHRGWRCRAGARACAGAIKEYSDKIPDFIFHAGIGNGREVPVLQEEFPLATWFGVEPNKQYYNNWRNCYPGVLREYALAEFTGMCGFDSSRERSRLCRAGHSSYNVHTVTLDCIKIAYDKVHFDGRGLLWIDIEGSECKVFQSGRSFLESIDWIWCETMQVPQKPNWCSHDEVEAELNTQGFIQIFRAGNYCAPKFGGDTLFVRKDMER